ncbi:hypothetical protein [Hydrogenobacter thermophilus]|uniref:hypothetical protein n=1 Tax=Hydrogenobacter thermophilus TaxID=940 RepID=UPI0030F9079A
MAKVVEVLSNAQMASCKNIVEWIESKLAGSPWSVVYSVNTANGKARYFTNGIYTIAIGGTAENETVDGISMLTNYLYIKLIQTKNANETEVPTGQNYTGIFNDSGSSITFPTSQTWLLVYTNNYFFVRCPEISLSFGIFTITAETLKAGLVVRTSGLSRISSMKNTSVTTDGSLITLSDVGTGAYTGGATDIALIPYFQKQANMIFPQQAGVYRPTGQSQAFLDEVTDGVNNHVIVIPNSLALRY